MTTDSSGPVIVVAGPTAGGKSALALDVAEKFSGTIINADALQVYREVSILTARPGDADLDRAPHRLYGALAADEPCSVGRWLDIALAEIDVAHGDGRVPIIVGGTGLYLRGLLNGLSGIPAVPGEIRSSAIRRYEEIGPEAFYAEVEARDPDTAARLSRTDRQRMIRAWEVHAATGRPLSAWLEEDRGAAPPHLRFLTLLIAPPRPVLFEACDRRFAKMVDDGAIDEVRSLRAQGVPPDAPVMKAVGVRPLLRYIDGEIPFDEALRLGARDTRRYAKRQMTWFRHQMDADRVFTEQYSESLKTEIFSFISNFLLTQSP